MGLVSEQQAGKHFDASASGAPQGVRVAASHKTQRAGAVSEALKQGDDKRIVLPLQRAVADLEDIEKLGHALDEFVEAGGVRKVMEEVIEHEEEVVPPEILD